VRVEIPQETALVAGRDVVSVPPSMKVSTTSGADRQVTRAMLETCG
jgi:hypothetical protein